MNETPSNSPDRPLLQGVLETVLYFTDQDRAERFYADVMGMRLLDREPGRSLFFRAGSSVFLLFRTEESLRGRTLPPHGATGPFHNRFSWQAGDYDRWKAYLPSRRVPILRETRWPNGLSFYFHDSEGNLLEIANADIWSP